MTAEGPPGGGPPTTAPVLGSAASFRRQRNADRSLRWGLYVRLAATVVIAVALLAILTARPVAPTASSGAAPPTTTVTLGSPTVTQVTCAGGAPAYAERVPWIAASAPVTSGDLVPKIVELFDGDIVNDPGAMPNATASNVCAGASPTGAARWYGVVSDPTGANVLTYTLGQGWAGIGTEPANQPIANDSTLTIVSGGSFSNSGYGLKIVGFANGSPIVGSITL